LPQDAWILKGGVLHESRVTLTAPVGAGDLGDPALLGEVDVEYEHVPVEGAPEVDADFGFLVDEYQQAIGEGAFQIPTATLACVRALARLSGGGFLLLSADKGYCREEELLRRDDPEIVRHGSISLGVDYHAVGRFVERLGGEALFPAHASRSLCFGAFLIDAPDGGAETRAAFAAAADGFGPDDWFTLKKGVEAACGEMRLTQLCAAIRAGGGDAKLFMDVVDRLLELSPGASAAERRACFGLGRRLWELYYEIGEERDLAFYLGVWMRELGYREEAIRYFERSRALRGPRGVTAFNLAYCHLGQQRAAEALRCVEEAIAADPGLSEARALRTEIRAILRDEAA
jgi:tetratricopeptide (TPR) repeat protein